MISLVTIIWRTILFFDVVIVLITMTVISAAAATSTTNRRFVLPVAVRLVGAKSFYPSKLRTTSTAFISSTLPSSTKIATVTKALPESIQINTRNLSCNSYPQSQFGVFTKYHCQQLPAARTTKSRPAATTTTTSLQMCSSNTDRPMYMNIGTEEMEEIIEDYEEGGRADSEYIIIDVRTDDEVINTGKLSPNTYTVPIQTIMEYNVFDLPDTDFEEVCGFSKPTYDETIVFTCKAGIRSVYACQYAAKSGYTKLINYTGGSSEWFATRRN